MSTNIDFEPLDLINWFQDLVVVSIHDLVKKELNISEEDEIEYNKLQYYPVYTRCKETGEKTPKSMNFRYENYNDSDFVNVGIESLEKSGASWEEFVIFMIQSNANLVNYRSIM